MKIRRAPLCLTLAALFVSAVPGATSLAQPRDRSPEPALVASHEIVERASWSVVPTDEGADAEKGSRQRTIRFDFGARKAVPPSESLTLAGVPMRDGSLESFELHPVDVFTPDARIVEVGPDGERAISRPTVRCFEGTSETGDPMFLALDGSAVTATVHHDDETYFINPPERARRGEHVIVYDATPPLGESTPFCSADSDPDYAAALSQWHEPSASKTTSTARLEADLMIDVNNSLYTGVFGSNSTTASNYVASLVGAGSLIYERDINVQLRVSSLYIWTTREPFYASGSSSAQLSSYLNWARANRTGVSRDVAHLLANGNVTNYGGVAYLNVLCNGSYGYGVSNIYGHQTFPVQGYSWDVNVTTHEIGHNFNSPHTHCFSPPIDMCYGQEQGCYIGPSVPVRGTIMSYCHLTSAGLDLVFHPRCVTVMRSAAEAAACLVATGGLDAPSNLVATGATQTTVSLSWTDNSTGETGFSIEAKAGAAGSYGQVATAGAGATTATVGGLTAGTQYTFRVRAFTATANGSYSNEATATTQSSGGGGGTTGEMIANGGFESGTASWTSSPASLINNLATTPSHAGAWEASLTATGSTLTQQPAFVAGTATRTLRFYLRITTSELSLQAGDRLAVQITNASGASVAALATFSNANRTTYTNYQLVTLQVPAAAAVPGNRLKFAVTANALRPTTFSVDDVSIQ